jgi:hypothetical protein
MRHAIFVDAHTAEIPEPILVKEITPAYKNSPFTHHLTPASCLELAEKLYQHAPHAILSPCEVIPLIFRVNFTRNKRVDRAGCADGDR